MRHSLRAHSLTMLLAAVCSAQTTPLPEVTGWPGGRVAAVSLTFDDAMQTHLDHVGPILRKHGLHGTFFVATGAEAWRKRGEEWKQLAAEGNEIGSHTVNHPCLLQRIEPHSQDYTPEMMENEIRESARAIAEKTSARRGMTFAFPCGNTSFGPPAMRSQNQALYIRFVSERYIAARGYDGSAAVDPEALDVLSVPSLGRTDGKDAIQLLEMMEPALRNHLWGVYTFHGVGGQWLSVTTEALDELASYLERHPEIWTAPFGDAVRYIQEKQALGLRTSGSGETSVQLALSWPLDPQVFDLPLTLKWELPTGWTACQAEGDEKVIVTRMLTESGKRIVLVDVPPKTETLRFEKR